MVLDVPKSDFYIENEPDSLSMVSLVDFGTVDLYLTLLRKLLHTTTTLLLLTIQKIPKLVPVDETNLIVCMSLLCRVDGVVMGWSHTKGKVR